MQLVCDAVVNFVNSQFANSIVSLRFPALNISRLVKRSPRVQL